MAAGSITAGTGVNIVEHSGVYAPTGIQITSPGAGQFQIQLNSPYTWSYRARVTFSSIYKADLNNNVFVTMI